MELVDTPLIAYAARRGKPLIISTGMGNKQDISEAYEAVGGGPVAFLHCTSEYPQTVEWSDLGGLSRLRAMLEEHTPVGVSDHTPGNLIVPVAGAALGMAILEKHLKPVAPFKTQDDEFSLEPEEFKMMVQLVATAYEAMQQREFISNPSRQLRRSLYVVADIKKGEPFTEGNIRSIRPGFGLSPKHLPRLLGKKADRAYRRGDRIT
jgi:N-acetylneuraminate synthase